MPEREKEQKHKPKIYAWTENKCDFTWKCDLLHIMDSLESYIDETFSTSRIQQTNYTILIISGDQNQIPSL